MRFPEQWIWLPKKLYPSFQTTAYNTFENNMPKSYCVAEFSKTYRFPGKITEAHLRFSGDTEFHLFINGAVVATGPAVVEGDFIGNDKPRPNFYAQEMTIYPDSDTLDFFARVKMMPVRLCDYSKGHGGFMLSAWVQFADGTKTVIHTDKSWQVRRNASYTEPYRYDSSILPDAYTGAEEINNIWNTKTAPIAVRTEKEITFLSPNKFCLSPGEEREVLLEADKIYAGFLCLDVKTKGKLSVTVTSKELENDLKQCINAFVFTTDDTYRGMQVLSTGLLIVHMKNESETEATVTVRYIATCYPVHTVAKTVTSDEDLNRVLSVCTHTLQYCRQLHHLDSPQHFEPLACTGDYYIETLMTVFSFGDLSLSVFDVIRTAELLRNNDGRMFHTTYSLIWVRMLLDVYMLTGNLQLLRDCEDALILLLNRFETYIGENGILDTPPDYMFVDWLYIDELSMHHPPKALGQTCLNMFYFGALKDAADIFTHLGETAMAEKCIEKRELLRVSVNTHLYDAEKGMYFEGLNTETPEELLCQYMPPNVQKRYYLKHSNILACYVGIRKPEESKELLHKIMKNVCPGEYQPYFAHFLLEAVEKNGLREEYTLKILEKWKAPVKECDKGLAEGFIQPEPTYIFDHSHAWGGTPLYSLPKALLGLKILKPGFSEISLSPSLLSLENATVELPTPYGLLTCKLKKGKDIAIEAPDDITVRILSTGGQT